MIVRPSASDAMLDYRCAMLRNTPDPVPIAYWDLMHGTLGLEYAPRAGRRPWTLGDKT